MANAPGAYGMNEYSSRYNAQPGLDPGRSSTTLAYSTQQPNNSSYYASRQTPPRTPSPTPSDIEEMNKPVIDWRMFDPRRWLHRKYLPYLILLGLILTLVILMSVYDKQIVKWMTPVSKKLKALPGGWAIPIGILFVISFPPLFGHEIIGILCGVIWGLWVGFGIVAAGTFLGEVGNYYAFKSICSSHGRKLEQNNLSYACLAHIVREGGFWIALVARFSAIPGHFTTAVFSTCGLGIILFSIAAILSLPKQLTVVYVGVLIEEAGNGTVSGREKLISDIVLVASVLITIVAAWWIYDQMAKAKPEVLRNRRRARARKEWEAGAMSGSNVHLTSHAAQPSMEDGRSVFNPNDSEEDGYARPTVAGTPYGAVPNSSEYSLNGRGGPVSVQPQRWDQSGRAVPSALENGYGSGRAYDRGGNGPRPSGDVVGWEQPRFDGGTTVASPSASRAGTYPPPVPQSQPAPAAYHDPYAPQPSSSSPPQSQPPPQQRQHTATTSLPYASATIPPPPSSSSQPQHPFATSPPQVQSPYQSPRQSPPPPSSYQPPSQPPPSSAPRYALNDGPAPSIRSEAPTYRTFDVPPSAGEVPRIPPPPGSAGPTGGSAY